MDNQIDLVTADCEADGLLHNVTRVHCIVVKEYKTGIIHRFWGDQLKTEFPKFAKRVKKWVIHNGLGYDIPLWDMMLNVKIPYQNCIDSLILSRMDDFDRRAPFNCEDSKAKRSPHGLGCWGYRVGLGKPDIDNWDIDMNDPVERKKMFNRCEVDVEINERTYTHLKESMDSKGFSPFSINLEHDFRWEMNRMEKHGFYLNVPKAVALQTKLDRRVEVIKAEVRASFPPKKKFEKRYIRKLGKDGNVSVVGLKGRVPEADTLVIVKEDIKALRKGFRNMSLEDKRYVNGQTEVLKERLQRAHQALNEAVPNDIDFFTYEKFDLGSPKQVVDRLNDIGWKPVNRTKTFMKYEKEYKAGLMPQEIFKEKQRMCWKATDEDNLATIPDDAPQSARLIAEHAWTRNRSSTITQWLAVVSPDNYLRGRITTIGAWSQRCSHQAPNMANLPSVSSFDAEVFPGGYRPFKKDKKTGVKTYGNYVVFDDMVELGYSPVLSGKARKNNIGVEIEIPVLGAGGRYGYEMRGCLTTADAKLRRIVGSDAAGIQLRALTHYMEDEGYMNAILTGDIHKYNASKLFSLSSPDMVTPDQRRVSKTFIYAFLLGAGDFKIGEITGIPEGGFIQLEARPNGNYTSTNTRTGVVEEITAEGVSKRGLMKYLEQTNWKTGKVIKRKPRTRISEKIAGGAQLRQQFLDGLPKLAELIKKAHKRADIGYMRGLDGRAVPVPSKHKSLTAYLQSYEAIIMKTAIVLWCKHSREMGLDAHAVAFVHDELQMDCSVEDSDKAGQLFVSCIKRAGTLYKSFIPLDGDALIGEHWADAH